MNDHPSLIDALAKAPIFQDYQRAFTEATGLPLSLRPVESWQLPLHGRKNENPFCKIMAQRSRACANCLQVQQTLSEKAVNGAHTAVCGAGLSETAVPLRVNEKLVGFLQTGQAFRHKPSAAHFDRTAKMASDWGVEVDVAELRDAYFAGPVLSPGQYESTVHLLEIFAEHLALVGKQMQVHEETSEHPVVARAKQFINEHHSDDLALDQVAKAVHMSMFYFCKLFKRVTGLNFTEYLAQVRIAKAKNLLLNPNLRVSEIGYEVGFQSLTHFNRVFKTLVGQSPSEYRDRLKASQLPRRAV